MAERWPGRARREWRYRYGLVLSLALAALLFVIASPERGWSRAIGFVLMSATFLVAVTTSRAPRAARRASLVVIPLAAVFIVWAAFSDGATRAVAYGVAAALAAGSGVAIAGGLARLLRDRGVTIQAVAGALALYLLAGIFFAYVFGVIAEAGDAAFFSDGTDGSHSDRMYFSFTSLTTTGFGDLAAAGRGGRSLAVLETLTGQLYLVTVVALLVSNLRQRKT